MNSRNNLAKGYDKYQFAIREEAEAAKERVERLFPTMKTKVSAGALFCHTNGDLDAQIKISAILGLTPIGGAGA